MLIGQSGARELLPRYIEMTRTGLRMLYFLSYFLQLTSHDFEYNRKTMLLEIKQPLLSWKLGQTPPYAQKSQPTPVLNFNSVSRRS